jgi:3-oxoacyl-[acyl-carrier-protein] synthase-1
VSEVAITGLGLVTPVGLTAASSCAAIRAGVSRLAELEGYFCLPPEGPAAEASDGPEPLVAGRVPSVPAELPGPERLARLALAALQRVLSEGALSRQAIGQTALVLALPSLDDGTRGWGLGEFFGTDLCQRAGLSGWASIHWLAGGAAGAVRQLDAARALLSAGTVEKVLVLAVDTFIDRDRLLFLDRSWRLRSTRNPDGFLPGEAAAAVLLERRKDAERRQVPLLGILGGAAFGAEPAPIVGERWSTSRGLCAALRPLLEGPEGTVGRWVLCDQNGEAYRGHEWGITQVKLGRVLPPEIALLHPADCLGEVGAAMAGALVACACQAFARGWAPAPAALLYCTADDGVRAALVVRPAA